MLPRYSPVSKSCNFLLYYVPIFPTTPKGDQPRAVAAPSLAEEVSPQRENILPKKEPTLQHSHYINKIRCPSSPGPGACGWGRRKEAGRGATALLSLPGLGMERLKGLLLPPQDKDLHLSCSHHIQQLVQTIVQRPCHRASSCGHLCGSRGTFRCSKMSPCSLLFPGVNNMLLAEHPPSQQPQCLVAPVPMLPTPATWLCSPEKFGKALQLCPRTVYPIYPAGDIQQ